MTPTERTCVCFILHLWLHLVRKKLFTLILTGLCLQASFRSESLHNKLSHTGEWTYRYCLLPSPACLHVACVVQQKDARQWFAELSVDMEKVRHIQLSCRGRYPPCECTLTLELFCNRSWRSSGWYWNSMTSGRTLMIERKWLLCSTRCPNPNPLLTGTTACSEWIAWHLGYQNHTTVF